MPDASTYGTELIDLRRISAAELSPLLLEETVEWRQEFAWDFGQSADLIRRFTDLKALDGCVLLERGELVGYGYSVVEDQKGLIGDVYVRPGWRNCGQELRIFRSLLDGLDANRLIRRVEGQLMNLDVAIGVALGRERFLKLYERTLMIFDPAISPKLLKRPTKRNFRVLPWAESYVDAAAGIISLAYRGHVDSEINDQYRSLYGARKFLHNMVEFPGCGIFHRAASFVAVDIETGWLAGIAISSFVAADVGHVAQLCVAPAMQGTGLGYELLRRSMEALMADGAKRISLTVTVNNDAALGLYRRIDFQEIRRFNGFVWESA